MSQQPVADRSVRTAWAADTAAIGQIQARAWTRLYGSVLPQAVLAEIDAHGFAEAWEHAVNRPPSARHRVLVALDGGEIVGFAATAPSEDDDAQPGDGEVVAFHVDPGALGAGHGSRLLSAAADTLRADGFTHARYWAIGADDAMRRFLESAGWAADGAHRTLDLPGPESGPETGPDAGPDGPAGEAPDTGEASDAGSRPDAAALKQVRLHTDLREEKA